MLPLLLGKLLLLIDPPAAAFILSSKPTENDDGPVVNRNPTSALVSRNFILTTLPVSLLARITEQAWRQSEDGEEVLSCCPFCWVRHICLSSCPTPKLLPTHHYLSLSV